MGFYLFDIQNSVSYCIVKNLQLKKSSLPYFLRAQNISNMVEMNNISGSGCDGKF